MAALPEGKYQAAISNNFMDVDVWKRFSFNHCVCGDIDLHRSRTFLYGVAADHCLRHQNGKRRNIPWIVLMNRVFVKNKKYTITYIYIYYSYIYIYYSYIYIYYSYIYIYTL